MNVGEPTEKPIKIKSKSVYPDACIITGNFTKLSRILSMYFVGIKCVAAAINNIR